MKTKLKSTTREELIKIVQNIDNMLLTLSKNEYGNTWLPGKEVCKLLNVSSRTLQKYRDTGVIGFSQTNRKQIYYKASDVEELLTKKYNNKFKKEHNGN